MGGVESGEFAGAILCRMSARAAQSSARRRRWKAVCEEECRAGFGLLRAGMGQQVGRAGLGWARVRGKKADWVAQPV